jgi:glycosyltransferase involved in cell wall biosynthesis
MRVIALLATYNEERFIVASLENLTKQGVDIYLLDNESTDDTVAYARRYLGRGLIGIETLPRGGYFALSKQLRRKEELAASLDADWFIHVDADEIHVPPHSSQTLNQALQAVEREGFNAVNFLEFTFIPTRECPDHDRPDYLKTMRWYYPFLPAFPHALRAWKRQNEPVELFWSGGHKVRFPGLRMYPESFRMRHYFFLSLQHALRKWGNRGFDPVIHPQISGVSDPWRGKLRPEILSLPSQSELRTYTTDDELDPSEPWKRHYLEKLVLEQEEHLS